MKAKEEDKMVERRHGGDGRRRGRNKGSTRVRPKTEEGFKRLKAGTGYFVTFQDFPI
jgi:hypothetical protein